MLHSYVPKSYSAKRRAEVMQAAKAHSKKLRMTVPSIPAPKTAKEDALEHQAQLKETLTTIEHQILDRQAEASIKDIELDALDEELSKLKRLQADKETEIEEKILAREDIESLIEEDKTALARFTVLYNQATEKVQVAESEELEIYHPPTMTIVNYAPSSGMNLEDIKSKLGLHKASDLLRFTFAKDLRELLRKLHVGHLQKQPEVAALWQGKTIDWKRTFGMEPTILCRRAAHNVYRKRLTTHLSLERDVVFAL